MKPEIYIDKKELAKIQWYVDRCDKEISGLGKLIKQEDGSLFINKIYLLEQECTGTSTDLDEEAVAKLLFEAKDDKGQMLFWWHSHVNMDVFWSGTDMDTIEELGGQGMIVASVFNKKGEIRTAIYKAGEGLAPDLFVDEIDLLVESDLSQEEIKDLEAEYKEKVKTYFYKYTPSKTTKTTKDDAKGNTVEPKTKIKISKDKLKKWNELTVEEKANFAEAYGWSYRRHPDLEDLEDLKLVILFADMNGYDIDEAWSNIDYTQVY